MYLEKFGINASFRWDHEVSFKDIKNNIDAGKPLIMSVGDAYNSYFGHVLVIIGYTSNKKLVVNDPYTNLQKYGKGWRGYETGRWEIDRPEIRSSGVFSTRSIRIISEDQDFEINISSRKVREDNKKNCSKKVLVRQQIVAKISLLIILKMISLSL